MDTKPDAVSLFEKEKSENIRAMTQDKNTKRIGRLFMDHVTDYKYGYYFTWMGRPIIQPLGKRKQSLYCCTKILAYP